ncbi:MAG: S-layer homology domain-containing protein [Bacillota bacterium]
MSRSSRRLEDEASRNIEVICGSSINWAAERGVVTGYADGSFKPDNAVSRAEVAQMLQN